MGPGAEWRTDAAEAGARLDHVLAARAAISHAAARRLLAEGRVLHNGHRAVKGARVREGDRLVVAGPLPGEAEPGPRPEPELPLDVLHVDAQLVVVGKPAGRPSHPLRAGEGGTVANALVARFPECATAADPVREGGLAHRLDRDTTGALLAARDPATWRGLRRAFSQGLVRKEYLAVAEGELRSARVVERALAHVPGDARRMVCVAEDSPGAQPARSEIQPLACAGGLTLVRVVARSGRTHQIRVHLASLGHPLVGDLLYGGPPADPRAPGHLLHAARLELPHPAGGHLDVQAPLPPDRAALLAALGLRAGEVGEAQPGRR